MATSQWLGSVTGFAVQSGYFVTLQSDCQAQLQKPKRKMNWFLFLFGILPGLIYLLLYRLLFTDRSLLLTDTGSSIKSSKGDGTVFEATYQELSEGKFNKLIRPDLSELWLVLISILSYPIIILLIDIL